MRDERAFFEAWFEGVALAGWRWFGDGEPDNERKQSKWDYTPRHDEIESAIGWLSSSEAVFLAAMYSFYNSDVGGAMLRELGVTGVGNVAACLDERRRSVIADLIVSYPGW